MEKIQIIKILLKKLLPNPTSFYGIAKYNCERLVEKFFILKKTPFSLLEPQEFTDLEMILIIMVHHYLHKNLKIKKALFYGEMDLKKEIIYIYDVVKIIDLLIIKNFSGFINICSNENRSFKFSFLINTLNKITKSKIHIISKPRSRQQVDQIMNNRFLKKIIGNYPFISIKKGLEKLIK